jgi:hypothetical protein
MIYKLSQSNNPIKTQKEIDYFPNYKSAFADDIMLQIGEHSSKLVFYNYHKIIDTANQTKQDLNKKIINTEIVIPNQVLKNLSYIMHYMLEIKNGLLSSIQPQLNQGTLEAYTRLSSLINSQYFDTDQSVDLSKFYQDFIELANSLKVEIEVSKPKDNKSTLV